MRFEVHEKLSGVLSHFYAITTPREGVYHLSPSLEMMVVFNFGAPVSFSFDDRDILDHTIERIGILGPLRRMMNYELKTDFDLLILNFVYDGFYRLLSEAAHTARLDEIWNRLAPLPGPVERVAALTDYLLAVISPVEEAAKPLLENVDEIHNPAVNPVKVMADKASVTERTVQMRFKKYTGYSPKELLRFLRFKQVMAFILARPKGKIDWFDLIVQYGYHDQSHLIKDFKYYTGVTPKQFIRLNDEGNLCLARD